MPGRNDSYANYRMGFNGYEKDDEISGKDEGTPVNKKL